MNDSLNIALVSPYDYASQGGVTEHIRHLSQGLRAQGHRTKILAPFSSALSEMPEDVYALGAVTQIPANGSIARISLSPDLGRTIKAILRTERFDVIHLHEPLMPAVPLAGAVAVCASAGAERAAVANKAKIIRLDIVCSSIWSRLRGGTWVNEQPRPEFCDGTCAISRCCCCACLPPWPRLSGGAFLCTATGAEVLPEDVGS